MLYRAKIINEESKECQIINQKQAEQLGWELIDIEFGYEGKAYLAGFAKAIPPKSYSEKRVEEYPSIAEQLDMIYHDINNWRAKIKEIKDKYPKE